MIRAKDIMRAMREEVESPDSTRILPPDVDEAAFMAWAYDYARLNAKIKPPGADEVLKRMTETCKREGLIKHDPTPGEAELVFHLTNCLGLGIRLGRNEE